MARIIEITGVPAGGKSFYIAKSDFNVFNICGPYLDSLQRVRIIKILVREFYVFYVGIKVLSLQDIYFFWKAAMREDVSLLNKLNIFRNIVRKFGVRKLINLSRSNDVFYIDEGISHIPFNLLNSKPSIVVDKLKPYLDITNIIYLEAPSLKKLAERLKLRGHKRLMRIDLHQFIDDNMEVNTYLLNTYPDLCESFQVVNSDA